jgi:hypothetical protein
LTHVGPLVAEDELDELRAGPHAAVSEESAAEKRARCVVAITYFLLSAARAR